jgi:L-alanine-DL-glutamate epimerase-like enolase superfamily enzyme
MAETKRIADHAESYQMPTVLHFAGSPIAVMANIHLRFPGLFEPTDEWNAPKLGFW